MANLWTKAPALVALFDTEEDPVTAAQKQYVQLGLTYYGNIAENIGATLQEALTQDCDFGCRKDATNCPDFTADVGIGGERGISLSLVHP